MQVFCSFLVGFRALGIRCLLMGEVSTAGLGTVSADFLEVVEKHVFCVLKIIFRLIYNFYALYPAWLCPLWPSACQNGISRLN